MGYITTVRIFLYLIKQFNEAVGSMDQRLSSYRQKELFIEQKKRQLDIYTPNFVRYLKEEATDNQIKEALNHTPLITFINSHYGVRLKEELENAGLFTSRMQRNA